MSTWPKRRIAWSVCSTARRCSNPNPGCRPDKSYQSSNVMLKNYFKIAIAVLKRRKFFTFISLFGISFTLTILLVLTAFIDKVVGDNYPDKKRDRSLYVSRISQGGKNVMKSGPPSFYFLNDYAARLKTLV